MHSKRGLEACAIKQASEEAIEGISNNGDGHERSGRSAISRWAIATRVQAYNTANPGYGFAGDPLRPQAGKYYGYLVRAGLY